MSKEILEVNYMKGLAIVLVFIGHAATPSFLPRPYAYEVLVQFIYSFHMSVFFLLSGFLSYRVMKINNVNSYINYCKNRIKRLLVPFITFSVFTNSLMILAKLLVNRELDFNYVLESIKISLIYPEKSIMGALWFIYTLLIISMISPILCKVNLRIVIIISILINILTPQYNYLVSISKVGFFLVFYLIGIYIRNEYNSGRGYRNFKIDFRIALFSVIFLLVYAYLISNGVNASKYIMKSYLFFCGIVGSILILYITLYLKRLGYSLNWLNLLGKYSMDIYLFSWFFQIISMIFITKILKIENYNVFFGSNIFLGALSLPFSIFIIRKINFISFICLGINKSEKILIKDDLIDI